ncbi:YqaJ viral recombinase family protein, partial [Gemmiger sp.]|uniref:YqaJ viral recombinase family protein n=1 Tax=Gemmiger sp. TaxID=2049027 RepID=UPI002A8B0ADC|nr:hypothetical protein [Gemmiger sp.]
MPEHIRREPKVLVSTEALTEQEWLAYRRRGIGGSDVAAILGISPFRTARDLYDDKLNIASAADDTGNWVALEMGHVQKQPEPVKATPQESAKADPLDAIMADDMPVPEQVTAEVVEKPKTVV